MLLILVGSSLVVAIQAPQWLHRARSGYTGLHGVNLIFFKKKSVHKKGNRSEKDNYQPVSILPNCQKSLKDVFITK